MLDPYADFLIFSYFFINKKMLDPYVDLFILSKLASPKIYFLQFSELSKIYKKTFSQPFLISATKYMQFLIFYVDWFQKGTRLVSLFSICISKKMLNWILIIIFILGIISYCSSTAIDSHGLDKGLGGLVENP